MSKIQYLSFYVILDILLVRGHIYTSVITTASGPIRGIISITIDNLNYAAFMGIPYAKPPIGNLRFKPPVKIDSWTDVYNASSECSICPQFNSTDVVGSEDCLYINVFTPHTEFNESISKPVMIWIHGGAFIGGSSSLSLHSPDFLLAEDVIVVSFNYRLGALGFLNLEHENAMGNCGLKDQNLALKWVKRNIAQFGGNPDQITIFGQSAGAVSVDLHVLSDMSVGLFSQSISMSGSPLCLYWGFQSGAAAVEKGFILGSKLGTNTHSKDTLLKTLYNASAADIVIATNDMDRISFKPSLEKSDIVTDQEKFLTECSVTKYVIGNYTKGPHMMGFTSDETISLYNSLDKVLKLTQLALKLLGNATSQVPCLSDLTNAVATGISGLDEGAKYQFVKQTTDLLFVLGVDTKQRFISRNNNYPIYYYRFSFESNYSFHQSIGVELEGAGHADDVPYILYAPLVRLPLNKSDIAVTKQRMVKLYTKFAKYGNPTPYGKNDEVLGIIWPDSRLHGEILEIGANLKTNMRPTDDTVNCLQLGGLSASPELNGCAKN